MPISDLKHQPLNYCRNKEVGCYIKPASIVNTVVCCVYLTSHKLRRRKHYGLQCWFIVLVKAQTQLARLQYATVNVANNQSYV